MFTVTKRMEISGAHFLRLNYESKCTSMHGHNWIVTVTVQNDTLDENGMVVDFTKTKDIVNLFDHQCANDIMEGLNPTAENMAKWLCDRIPHCIRVAVQETEGNTAVYEK
jgi:putative 6-pyruvoyltetrahydropterin synthase